MFSFLRESGNTGQFITLQLEQANKFKLEGNWGRDRRLEPPQLKYIRESGNPGISDMGLPPLLRNPNLLVKLGKSWLD